MTDIAADTKVSEMTVAELANVFLGLMKHYDDVMKGSDGSQVGKLPLNEFRTLMQQVLESRQYQMAEAEREITQRIFKDTDGLRIIGTTWRISDVEKLEKFYTDFKELLSSDPNKEMVICLALWDKDYKTYMPAV